MQIGIIENNFKVGKLTIHGDLILAPMDGISDMPFRSLTRRLGSAASYTEFITASDVVYGTPFLEKKIAFSELERPLVYQICDDEPQRLLQAALRLQERQPDFIDINLGCPARTVSGRGAGSGLLRNPELIAEIFQLLVPALEVPVTAKIRLGWDQQNRNYMQIARIIQENGGQLLAVHGRTREQKFNEQADWDAIAEIKQALSIPVIANGDVKTVSDIDRIKQQTGCDAVMIGRAAIGNPWIFSRIDRAQVPIDMVHRTAMEQLQSLQDFYGESHGLVLFRKFIKRYLDPYQPPVEFMEEILTCENPRMFRQKLAKFFADLNTPRFSQGN